MKKHSRLIAPLVISLSLVFAAGGGVAMANGSSHGGNGQGHSPGHTGVAATGSTTCNFHGRVAVDSNGLLSITGNITPGKGMKGKACTSTGGAKIKTGHFTSPLTSTPPPTTTTSSSPTTSSPTTSSTTTTTVAACSLLPVGALSNVSGGTITWSPRPKSAPSVGIALSSGAVSMVTVDGEQFLQVTYSAGSVASGSFATASGAAMTLTSRQTVAELNSACAGGASSFAFHGTVTL